MTQQGEPSAGTPTQIPGRLSGMEQRLTGRLFAATALLGGALLIGGRSLFLDRADMTRALLIAGLRRPLPAETDPNRTLVLVPSPASLERIVAAYGDPRTDSLAPAAVRPIPPDVQTEADRRVRYGAPVPHQDGS